MFAKTRPLVSRWACDHTKMIVRPAKFDRREAVVKQSNTMRACEHFDDFYGNFYGSLWPSMRLALLSQPKYCALVNYLGDYENTCNMLRELGCVEVQQSFTEKSQRAPQQKRHKGSSRKNATDQLFKATNNPYTADETREDLTDRVILAGSPEMAAALSNFVPATKLKGMEDFLVEEDQLKYYEESAEFQVVQEEDDVICFPTLLRAFMFPRGDVSRFPPPKRSSYGTSNYYLMDAASLLPVLALDLQPSDSFLDLCAAPGGKTLVALQTFYPERIVSNDATRSRTQRLKNVLGQFLGQSHSWKERLTVSQCDGREWCQYESFDRVLVDVPCSIDRHSVTEEDNNLFKPTRMKERIKLPELQTELLCAGVRACKAGGTVVYSTCSLSPIQNDGVVYMALKQLKEVHDIDVVVKNMKRTAQHFDFMTRWAPDRLMRYGHQVIPSLSNNYGPMYIAKLERIS